MTSADLYEKFPTTYYFATASNTSGDIAIPAYNSFTLVMFSQGLSGAGTSQLVFNADTGTNYANRFIQMPSGSTTPTNTANVSPAAAFIFTPSATTPFIAVFKVQNFVSIAKAITFRVSFQNTSGGPIVLMGGGDYVNTTTQITQIRMTTSANNYGVGSGFGVYGGDGL